MTHADPMPESDVDTHPLVAAARTLADDLLAPQAADVDAHGVPRSHLAAMARAGLLGLAAPVQSGPAAPPTRPDVVRAVAEALAGADAATWFVQAQHHSPVRMLANNSGPAAQRYLTALAAGDVIAGIAFSHLRRFPARLVTATRTSAGWRFHGDVPWYTGWGLNDVAFIGALTDDAQVVFGVVPAREQPGLSVSSRVETAALSAARTVALRLEDLLVCDDDVALVQDHDAWATADRLASANANPAVFGVGASGVRLLQEAADLRGEIATGDAAAALGEWLTDVRRRAYVLADDVSAPRIDERLALRAEALEATVAATSALVAANAGAAMAVGAAAQRKAREALFLMVQAQTSAGRSATLQRWAASARQRLSALP